MTGAVNLLVDVSDRAVAYESRPASRRNRRDLGRCHPHQGSRRHHHQLERAEPNGCLAMPPRRSSASRFRCSCCPTAPTKSRTSWHASAPASASSTMRRRGARKDGSLVDISLSVSPIQDHSGRITGASTIARDISERRRAEEQQHLLIREMDHRVKNLFSLASSIVSLSRRSATSVDDLASAVVSRLNALSQAHALTVPHTSTANMRLQQGDHTAHPHAHHPVAI